MRLVLYFLLLIITACASSKTSNNTTVPNVLEPHIKSITQQYAPDKRVALFQVAAKGNIVTGETNLPAAKRALLQALQSAGINYIDSIKVLPGEELKSKHHAVVGVSVANLRTLPRHQAELATQATLGTPLKVFKRERGWYLVQTPDQYLSWVEGGSIELMDSAQLTAWQQKPKLFYTKPFGFAYETTNTEGATISDLVFGDMMELKNISSSFYEVSFPDGRNAFVPITEATDFKTWSKSRQPTEENLVKTAKQLMGIPYLWGGTSFKGVDCSGFTKTVYLMNGLVLPRDASQQVNIGEAVDTKDGWQNLKPGDLLFFGSPAQNGNPERVVHVGMWIGGNAEFIHSSSRVQIGSLNPTAPNYDASEHKRFLRAKRITPSSALFDLRTASF